MPRRRQSLVSLVSQLPWWAGLLIGLLLWVVATEVVTLSGAFAPAIEPIQTMAGALLAGACVIGALISLAVRLKQRVLLESQHSLDQIRSLSWQDFEHLMAEAFRREGYEATCTGPGPDDGVDLILARSGTRWLVQCKQWLTRRVGVRPVRELAGVVAASGADGGVFVTSGTYTDDARVFAQQAGLRLIDGEALARMLDIPGSPANTLGDTCPRCGDSLVRRVARRGRSSGQAFLGCSSFPGCRFTRSLE